MKAKALTVQLCSIDESRDFIAQWHSRLPNTQRGPWQYAFEAVSDDQRYATALWHNPSTRSLPHHWLELRRMAVANNAPHCTASWFLGQMTRWFRRECPNRERVISYQDLAVHTGTIYLAAGWTPAYVSRPRIRDRSKNRVGCNRLYRSNLNGIAVDAAPKVRWEKMLDNSPIEPVPQRDIERMVVLWKSGKITR